MRKHNLVLAAFAATLFISLACSRDITDPGVVYDHISVGLDPAVRVSHENQDNKMALAWEAGDRLTIIGSTTEIYDIEEGFTDHSAHFKGIAVEGDRFTVLYPGTYTSLAEITARDYRNQTQVGNASTDHLEYNVVLSGLSDYREFSFSPDWATGMGATLNQNGIIRFHLQMPDGVTTVSSITLTAEDDIFYPTNGTDSKVSSLTLNLSGVDVSSNNQELTAYMNVSWQSVPLAAGEQLCLSLQTNRGELKKYFSAKTATTIRGGKMFQFKLNKNQWKDTSDGVLSDYEGVVLFEDTDTPPSAEYKILFIGNSFTQDAVWLLPGIFRNNGVNNVKMIDNYIGGHFLWEYNNEFETGTENKAYLSTPSNPDWTNQTGLTLQEICASEEWDVVTLQEHTGNHVAWTWDTTEKEAIQSLIQKIKDTQGTHTPKFYYLLSQAYYDFARMSGQKSYWSFDTQSEMYGVCLDFAQNAIRDCGFDGIIPSGTYLQNIRTSTVNSPMDMTRDGYHMDYGLARYGAACTVYETCIKPLVGKELGSNYTNTDNNITSTAHRTPVTEENGAVARQAAALAVAKPYEITDMGGRTTSGGISTAYEFVDFALAVNNGDDLARFQNSEGKIVLKNDIDMSGVRIWIPIGRTTTGWSSKVLKVSIGHPFTGHFDGQGHSIKNLVMTCDNAINYRSWGLFGCIADGGVVENLVIDSSCSITVGPANQTEFGVVAGIVLDGTVRNVVNNADITVSKFPATPSSTARLSVGMVGFAYADKGALLENLVNNGDIITKVSTTGKNYFPAGIVGIVTNSNSATGQMTVKGCVMNGYVIGQQANTGAGIVALVDQPNIVFQSCKSKGCIVTDRTVSNGLVGTFFGNCKYATSFTDCVSSARMASYNNGSWSYYTITSDNYLDYIGTYTDATGLTRTGIRFAE